MARPPQEAIDTFISITGATEAVAVRKLEEHGGDLNAAVNAHFNEGDRTLTNPNPIPADNDDMMEIDDPLDHAFGRPASLLAETLGNPFALLDPNLRRNFLEGVGAPDIFNRGPQVSHPRGTREIPIEVKDSNPQTGTSGQGPIIEDVTGHESSYGPEIHGTVIVDDEDDDDLPSAHSALDTNLHGNASHPNNSTPSAPPLVDVSDSNNDIEEEMIRAVIEASKRDAEGLSDQQFAISDDPTSHGRENRPRAMDDDELARAVSLSLETAEQERALRQQEMHSGDQSSGLSDKEAMERATKTDGRQELVTGKVGTSRQSVDEGSFQEESEDIEEQPLVRNRPRRLPSGNEESTQSVQADCSPPSSPRPHNIRSDHQYNGDHFPSEEWGGISSEEHDEALMLEAAMFGGIPEGAAYQFAYPHHRSSGRYPRVPPRPPSPGLTEQRLLREQQDDEYLASLQADQEKELKAMQEAELRRAEEAAAREAALQKQKQEEEESHRKQLEEEELESKLAAIQASLPPEPPQDDENAVTLLVRMPDGSRHGRRFLKSDKLQFLFDFIDIGRTAKPGTYRLVRPYPRRAFTAGETELSFSDLGLTGKQEALFLELI